MFFSSTGTDNTLCLLTFSKYKFEFFSRKIYFYLKFFFFPRIFWSERFRSTNKMYTPILMTKKNVYTFQLILRKKSQSSKIKWGRLLLQSMLNRPQQCLGRVRFGAADSAPSFRRWTIRRRIFRRRDYSAPELFFLDSLFCSYVVSVCSSLRSR